MSFSGQVFYTEYIERIGRKLRNGFYSVYKNFIIKRSLIISLRDLNMSFLRRAVSYKEFHGRNHSI